MHDVSPYPREGHPTDSFFKEGENELHVYESISMEPKHERRKLMYLQWEDKFNIEKPYQIVSENISELDGLARSNITMIEGPEEMIEDIRGRETTFDLDKNGFKVLKYTFPAIDYQRNQDVEEIYKPEVEELLKRNVEGVDKVVFFNWRLRLNVARDSLANLNDPLVPLVPAHNVHLDQSPATAVQYVYEKMGDDAEAYLQGRVRIFNIWRPYAHSVGDCPLALCDGSTIRKSDLIVCDNIQKTRLGETLLPLYNPNAKWYYLNGQESDEVIVIKIFDSDTDVAATCCPHTAFYHKQIPTDTLPRQSIEDSRFAANIFVLREHWGDVKVGTLDPEKWRISKSFVKPVASATEQMLKETTSVYAKIRELAKEFDMNVPLHLVEDFEYEGRNATQTLMVADLKGDMDNYLGSLKGSKVKSLQELVEWNSAHVEEALTADKLEAALNFGNSVEACERPLAHSKAVVASFNDIVEQYDLDFIIGPGDCWLSTFSAAGEFPIATLPMSYLDFNGRPIGLIIAAPRHKESTLIKVMSAWEATFPARQEPREFVKHSSVAQEL